MEDGYRAKGKHSKCENAIHDFYGKNGYGSCGDDCIKLWKIDEQNEINRKMDDQNEKEKNRILE